jgi:hypothetical protein
VFWIGLGSITALALVIFPYLAKERCKTRWTPLEGIWSYESGCMVRVGNTLIREEYVSVAPVKRK